MPLTQNLFTYSDAFDNAAWLKTNTTPTPGAADPFGGAGAYTLVDSVDGSAQSHYVRQGAAITQTRNAYWSVSVYAKAGAKSWVWIWEAATGLGGSFDLTNGVTGTPSAGTSLVMESAGGGWWKCTITYFSSLSTLGSSMIVQPAVSASVNTYQGAGAVAITVYSAQAAQANWTGPRATTPAKVLNNGPIRSRTALAQNLVTLSETNGALGTGVTAIGAATDPFGGSGANQLSYDGSSTAGNIRWYGPSAGLITGNVGRWMTWSIWLRVTSGTRNMRMRVLGSVATSQFTDIGTVTGTWQRFSCSFYMLDSSPNALTYYLYDGTGLNTAFTFETFGSQVNYGQSVIPSYTKTTGSMVLGTYGNPRSIA